MIGIKFLFYGKYVVMIAKPFVKWAGGKGQLINQFMTYLPKELKENKIDYYYEPFLGGGALFFWLIANYSFKKVFLNELNKDLYVCYKALQRNPKLVINYLHEYEGIFLNSADKESFFYDLRDEYNKKWTFNTAKYNRYVYPHRAAQTIFLNRTCFNGLYRVNSGGSFNVPFGKYKNPCICDEKNLKAVSSVLKGVEITNHDFGYIKEIIRENSFVYFDPPYRPLTTTASFKAYINESFDDKDQERLAYVYRCLDKVNNVKLLLSNSDPRNMSETDHYFDELYKGYHIKRIMAKRMINCISSKRGPISELIIMNYGENI